MTLIIPMPGENVPAFHAWYFLTFDYFHMGNVLHSLPAITSHDSLRQQCSHFIFPPTQFYGGVLALFALDLDSWRLLFRAYILYTSICKMSVFKVRESRTSP